MSFAIPVSVLKDLQDQFKGRRIKTKKLSGEEELGTVRAAVLINGDVANTAETMYGSKLGFLVETDLGTVEVWSLGTLVPHRQIPVEHTLLDDVQSGELTTAKFAEIVGIPLDIAENLIEVYGQKDTAKT